jgi:hypothetical protein
MPVSPKTRMSSQALESMSSMDPPASHCDEMTGGVGVPPPPTGDQNENQTTSEPLYPWIKYRNRGEHPDYPWRLLFLHALRGGVSISDAIRMSGVSHNLPYWLRAKDKKFREEWNEAVALGTKLLEQEAERRAFHGTLKPVFYKGVKCGDIREFSDTLLMFVLKKRDPRYRNDGGATIINNNNKINAVSMFDDIERDIKLIEGITSPDSSVPQNGAAEPLDEAQANGAEASPEADRLPDGS